MSGIVLDDEQRVAQVAQALQNFDQAIRVARMQADGRLVEHVERANQVRAERRGELNALRFAAGKRGGEAVERQVVEADFVEESQALLNFFEHLFRDGGFGRAELQSCRRTAALPSPSSGRLR